MRKKKQFQAPSSDELQQELKRIQTKRRFRSIMRSTISTLIVVAAIAILVATLWMPVLQTYGSSMTPTLQDGEIVLSLKSGKFECGDMIAFYYNNKILIKRVIAGPADWVNIDSGGTVYINGVPIDEPYIEEKAFGDCDIELPYQVPEARYFVMGDHRSVSIDSRHTSIGCVAEEQIVGKIVFRVWPLSAFGKLD